jgi:hypothetical protein
VAEAGVTGGEEKEGCTGGLVLFQSDLAAQPFQGGEAEEGLRVCVCVCVSK